MGSKNLRRYSEEKPNKRKNLKRRNSKFEKESIIRNLRKRRKKKILKKDETNH